MCFVLVMGLFGLVGEFGLFAWWVLGFCVWVVFVLCVFAFAFVFVF